MSLPKIINDVRILDKLKHIFCYHGALGYRYEASYKHISGITELEKNEIVPYIFGLIPLSALASTRSVGSKIKPQIAAHLEKFGLNHSDDILISTIKSVADQYHLTKIELRGHKKHGMRDLRSKPRLYNVLKDRQNNRCSLCGSIFNGPIIETLDHVIPYHIVGDIPDGANWQILCEQCNGGKSDYFSALQPICARNWVYATGFCTTVSNELKYVVLANQRRCSICQKTSADRQLFVECIDNSLPLIASNLIVRCEEHATGCITDS